MEAIAGILLEPLYNIICSPCGFISKKISDLVNVDERIRTLATALNELKEIKEDLKRQVERAEVEGQSCTSQVKGWLQRTEATEIEANYILQSQNPARCYCLNCPSIYKKSEKVSKALKKIQRL